MEYRQFGNSGLKVPSLSFGTATFGGTTEVYKRWGETEIKEASRIIDICLENGIHFFDTADVYSFGESERILGAALKGKRDKVLISTKATFPMGQNPNDKGASRHHLIKACDDSLKRLNTDYIDVYFMHGFDGITPLEETLSTLDTLIKSGKIRYIGCSNFSGWHLMKSLTTSEKLGLNRYVVYQGYYSLVGREYEWELMPLNNDQKIGLMVWSPLGWGRLTGKILREKDISNGRIKNGGAYGGPIIDNEYLYTVLDALNKISNETEKSIPQVAINWLLQRPTVCNVVLGARNEDQLKQNLKALEWKLTPDQISYLDNASKKDPIYPYWHQKGFIERIPTPIKY